jgi:twitching motility two-component system response regulator PilH
MARVLIVEDSATQAAIISEIMKGAGHEPVVCKDFSKGIAQTLKPLNPEIVLLDLILLGPNGKPIADGFQICREVKRVSKNKIGVVIVSSKGDTESAEWALLQGADAFLQKPFAVDDLLNVVQEVLAASR